MFVIGGPAASYLLHCSGFVGITALCYQRGWLPRRNECQPRRASQLRCVIPPLKFPRRDLAALRPGTISASSRSLRSSRQTPSFLRVQGVRLKVGGSGLGCAQGSVALQTFLNPQRGAGWAEPAPGRCVALLSHLPRSRWHVDCCSTAQECGEPDAPDCECLV